MSKKVEKSAVIITIKDASNMTEQGKKDIAEWMIRQAKDLLKHGKDYGKTCVCRYRYFKGI